MKSLGPLMALRMLRQRGIAHEVLRHSEEYQDAESVVNALGLPPLSFFKTLALRAKSGGEPLLALLPSNHNLDLRRLAKAASEKRIRMMTKKDAEQETGLRVGGISALALLDRSWPIYLDTCANGADRLVMSAGRRGWQVSIAKDDFIKLTQARLASITSTHSPRPS